MIDNYKSKLKTLTDIVNSEDPVGLIELGSPSDEYSSEIARILSLVTNNKNSDLLQGVYDIFQKSFGPDTYIDINKIRTIVEKINKL